MIRAKFHRKAEQDIVLSKFISVYYKKDLAKNQQEAIYMHITWQFGW